MHQLLPLHLTPRRQDAEAQRFFPCSSVSWRLGASVLMAFLAAATCAAQSITVAPSDTNAYSQGATSVLLTYSGLGSYMPAEATWCGALQPAAAPDRGSQCNPTTLFGRLPARYNQSRLSGNGNYTDIMSVTPAVARKAYLDAVQGATATFFYVRRFTANGQPDQYVAVTIRLTGNGAAAPLSLTNVKLGWGVNKSVILVKSGEKLPPVQAEINYTGTGRLIGRWELVKPGEDMPTARDLLPEASLPPEERGRQRRFAQLTRFNIFLQPNGKTVLPVPEVWRLDQSIAGMYLILLRIEASDDALNQSANGSTVISSGATAGFAMPTLRYYVGSGGLTRIDNEILAGAAVSMLLPENNAVSVIGQPLEFAWPSVERTAYYVLEISDAQEVQVFSAVLLPDAQTYRAPSWLAEKLGPAKFTWRIKAYGPGRKFLQQTPARVLKLQND